MKHASIRFKITLWFAAALTVIIALTAGVMLTVSESVLQESLRSGLMEAVEKNLEEVDFHSTEDGDDGERLLPYGGGYVEIEDDFLSRVNGATVGLYGADGVLLYGQTDRQAPANLAMQDGVVQKTVVENISCLVFDRAVETEGGPALWLRGVAPENGAQSQLSAMIRLSLMALPLLLLLACGGGYWIAGRMLRPIQQISDAADQIGQGRDLKRRIALSPGDDELHRLAETFNAMFDRLDGSFETERQFTSDASHELRTPMSVILAQCEYSLSQPKNAQEDRQALVVIQRQGKKMARLIEDMLRFARLERKSDSFPMEELDLSELTSTLCEDLALLREQGIVLCYTVEEHVVVRGNRELLSRLVTNLVSNAYRYGVPGGHITVALCRAGKSAQLSVSDDGIGIPPEQQEKIFRRFYQADSSHTSQGAGLGLAMALEIARFHGGTLRVESVPGEGSTFFLEMPLF